MILANGAYRALAPQAFAETTPQFFQSYFMPRLGLPMETAFASYGQLYRNQVWVAAAVNKISDSIARLPLHVWHESDSGKEIDTSSPYAQLLARPCVTMDNFAFKQWLAATIEIYGETYLCKIREGRGNEVTSLLPMHPAMVMIKRDEYGEQQYKFLGRPNELFTERDVVPFRRFNPDNTMRGLSRLEALRSTLMTEDSSRRAMQAWWQNRMRPSMILRARRELGDLGRERVANSVSAQHGGSGNSGRVMVLENDEFEEPTIVQNTADEMQYIQTRQLAREEVAAGMDIPPTALQDMTRATFCLPADAQISTRTGPKPITDVFSGDEVWAYDGEKLKLSEVTWSGQTGQLPVYTIKTENRTLRATGNHPVLVARWSVRYPEKKTHRYGPPEFVWIPVEQLKVGDLLVAAHGQATHTKRTCAPNRRPVTRELMEFCGLLMGDGTVNRGSVSIAHDKNARYIEHYKECARSLFTRVMVPNSRTPRYEPIFWHKGSERSSRFSSVSAAQELRDLGFGGNAYTKSIPSWVFECSEEMRFAFLRGIIEADGSVSSLGRITFGLCNKHMVTQVRDMMIGLGVPVTNLYTKHNVVTLPNGQLFDSTFYTFTASDPGQNQYIGSHDPIDERRMLDGKPFDLRAYRYGDRLKRVITPPQGAALCKIKSITASDEPVPVYDLTVPDGHSFVADGVVVHNSNVVENMRSLYRDSITPRVEFIESVLRTHVGSEFNGPKNAKFDMRHVLRGEWEKRADAHARMIQSGFEKPAEARVDMDLPDAGPVADQLFAQQQIQPLGAPPANAALPGSDGAGGESSRPTPSEPPALTNGRVAKYVRDISSLIGRNDKTLQDAANILIAKTGDRDGVKAAFEYLLDRQL